MSLVARLFLLYQQLKSKNFRLCDRCALPFAPEQTNCPHCTGLSDSEIEDLIEQKRKAQFGTILYLVAIFIGLGFLFGIMVWLK